jgi:hypothetical protein
MTRRLNRFFSCINFHLHIALEHRLDSRFLEIQENRKNGLKSFNTAALCDISAYPAN